MRKIILNLAISLDGYIADSDGGYDWITGDGNNRLNTDEIFDFSKFLQGIDTIIMGENAYNDTDISMFEDKEIVVTSYKDLGEKENVKVIQGNICEQIEQLQKMENKKDIWLFGGGVMIDPILKSGLIDEYIIGIIPIILGKGKPLFLKDNPKIELHLEEYSFSEGVGILKYTKRKK